MNVLRAIVLLVSMCAAWLTAAEHAHAQESADALVDEGVSLREQGRDAEALERFRRAHELSPSARALAQQALAEQALGRWVDAHDHLVAALDDTSNPWIAQNRAALQGALQRIRERVGHLEVVDGVPGAEVHVNGASAGTLPLARPITVPTGTVVLEVRAAGYVPLRRTIEVWGGGRARESVVLVPVGQPVEEGGAPTASASGSQGPASSVAAGPDGASIAGATVLAAAGVGGVVAAIVGMAGTGCLAMEGAICVEERAPNWASVGIYGGAGLAAVIGGVIWLAVALSSGPSAAAHGALRPTAGGMAWSF